MCAVRKYRGDYMASKSAPAQGKESKEEQIGFHKGSLSTLVKERQELARILGIVEQAAGQQPAAGAKPKKKPIDDLI
jgi:hypothetical protein